MSPVTWDRTRSSATLQSEEPSTFTWRPQLVNIMAIFSIHSSLSNSFFVEQPMPVSFPLCQYNRVWVILVALFIRRATTEERHARTTPLDFSITILSFNSFYRVPLPQLLWLRKRSRFNSRISALLGKIFISIGKLEKNGLVFVRGNVTFIKIKSSSKIYILTIYGSIFCESETIMNNHTNREVREMKRKNEIFWSTYETYNHPF